MLTEVGPEKVELPKTGGKEGTKKVTERDAIGLSDQDLGGIKGLA